jgi:hypothetical protein
MRSICTAALLAFGMASGLCAGQAVAQPFNQPPPIGPVILNLNGTPIPATYQPYTTSFTASGPLTNLTFAFRDDPSYLFLDYVAVTTGGGANLVQNGDFSLGPVNYPAPVDWTYLSAFGATSGGVVGSYCGATGGNCYVDGAVQAYDAITQAINTTVGDLYTVTFDLAETSGLASFSALSTNGDVSDYGGNGVNLVVYAGSIPVSAPEPASLALIGVALAGLGVARRRHV